ncbi:MAG: rod shape-determining protein MreC, partial [Candidatus Nomurabacteria bacterium]|nr:rod shape-determining protein MreC [Candidatus Nomurabacteria bacterium]
MSYLQDKKKENKRIRNFIILFVCLLLAVAFNKSIFSGLSYVANTFFKPVVRVGNNIRANFENKKLLFASKKSLEIENNNLKQKLLELEIKGIDYAVLEDENNKLKEVFSRKSENTDYILGAILSKPNKSAYDTLLLDVGSDDGVVLGNLVFAVGDVPLGRVSQVFDDSAKVTLFSTSGENTEVVINNSGAFMQVVGRGGGNFEMTLPRDFDLPEGTALTLPGINSYLLARVVTVISDP